MPKPNYQTSHQILSLLEREKIRVILRDGSVLEGKVLEASADSLRLEDTVIPLNNIATYFVLRES